MPEERVDIIASGYEWTCPHCGELNQSYEYRQQYYCSKCDRLVKTDLPEHALEN